jgi:hypothetical protein
LLKIQPGCNPVVCSPKKSAYIRYNRFPDLFHFAIGSNICSIQIEPKLKLLEHLGLPGVTVNKTKKWDVLRIDGSAAVEAFADALEKCSSDIQLALTKKRKARFRDHCSSQTAFPPRLRSVRVSLFPWSAGSSNYSFLIGSIPEPASTIRRICL